VEPLGGGVHLAETPHTHFLLALFGSTREKMKLNVQGAEARVPDILLIGAAKSGTTSLSYYLRQHPQLYVPMDKKEPHYFTFGGQPPTYEDPAFVAPLVWRTSDYLKLYKDAREGQLIADCSTSYLYESTASIRNIQGFYGPRAKELSILAVLREPAARAFSHWQYLVRNGAETLPFEEAIDPATIAKRKRQRWGYDYLAYGTYSNAVALYKEHFPRTRFFLFHEMRDPLKLMGEVCRFLGIAPLAHVDEVRTNPSGIPKSKGVVHTLRRNPVLRGLVRALPDGLRTKALLARNEVMQRTMVRQEMDPAAKERLRAFFAPEVQRLQEVLGQDLSHWNA
jgi:Sulfotransferase domain